jgi:hypothetical protein
MHLDTAAGREWFRPDQKILEIFHFLLADETQP